MFKQLLLLALVVVVVMLVTRYGGAARSALSGRSAPSAKAGKDRQQPSRTAIAGYSLVLVAVIASAGLFYVQWQEANTVVTVEVVDGDTGETDSYQVRRKDLDGREFRTVDGRRISLGADDRMILVEE